MNEKLTDMQMKTEKGAKLMTESATVYPGIELIYLESEGGSVSPQPSVPEGMMMINYCRSGQMALRSASGEYIYLNPGDFSVCTVGEGLPAGQYSGFVISVDTGKTNELPDILTDAGIFARELYEKYRRRGPLSFFAGNEQTKAIFSSFYDQPERLRLPYRRIKTAELLLYLSAQEQEQHDRTVSHRSEQAEMIREIHDRLIDQMGERITIEELSRQYLINPTTLKAAFKSVYGESIAAHIKEHRMDRAAKLLRESDMSIAEISQAVGYDSQSKFTAAFKAFFKVLPREYKKNSAGDALDGECEPGAEKKE